MTKLILLVLLGFAAFYIYATEPRLRAAMEQHLDRPTPPADPADAGKPAAAPEPKATDAGKPAAAQEPTDPRPAHAFLARLPARFSQGDLARLFESVCSDARGLHAVKVGRGSKHFQELRYEAQCEFSGDLVAHFTWSDRLKDTDPGRHHRVLVTVLEGDEQLAIREEPRFDVVGGVHRALVHYSTARPPDAGADADDTLYRLFD